MNNSDKQDGFSSDAAELNRFTPQWAGVNNSDKQARISSDAAELRYVHPPMRAGVNNSDKQTGISSDAAELSIPLSIDTDGPPDNQGALGSQSLMLFTPPITKGHWVNN